MRNILKRSLISITKLKKRTIILSSLFFIISISLITGAIVQNSIKDTVGEIKKSLKPQISIEVDFEKMLMSMGSTSPNSDKTQNIDDSLINKIENSSYVNRYVVYDNVDVETEFSKEGNSNAYDNDYNNKNFDKLETIDSVDDALGKDHIKIMEGHRPTNSNSKNEILISKDYAEKHKLKTNDILKLYSLDNMKRVKEYKASISGIYEKEKTDSDFNSETFYSGRFLERKMKQDAKTDYQDTPLAYYSKVKVELNKVDDTEKFLSEIKTKGKDFSSLKVESSYHQYKMLHSVMNKIVSTIYILCLTTFVIGSIMIVLITLLSLRERKYEIGVLLALGESRSKIIIQFFIESIMVLVISFLLSFVISDKIIKPNLVNSINSQISQTISTNNAKQDPSMKGPNYKDDKDLKLSENIQIKELTTKTTILKIVPIFMMLFIITILSTVLPINRIMKQSPRSILSSTE